MNLNEKDRRIAIVLAIVTGFIISITYPLMITYHANDLWSLTMEIIFGPFFIISNFGLFIFIQRSGSSIYNLLAFIFHAFAGFSNTLMLNIQKAVFSLGNDYRSAENELSKEIIQRSFQSGNLVQLGIDFCFDVFVSMGTILLGIAILNQKRLQNWLGYPGVIIGFGGLVINMITFPTPPANVDYPDPGPFFGIYFGIVLLNMLFIIINSRKYGIQWA